MNGHLKRVLILLLIFTFVFQMAGVTSLSRVQAYADTETAETVDVPEADEAEEMTTEEIDTESPGEIETDGENPPDAAEEPAEPETASEETAEASDETAAEDEATAEAPEEEAAHEITDEPVTVKAEAKAADTNNGRTVLAFTSDIHNSSDNTARNRMNTWIRAVESNTDEYGEIETFAFCGDMGSVSNTSESNYWTYSKAVMDAISTEGIEGIYTTGNHEFYPGNYSSTQNTVKDNYIKDAEAKNGDNYRIYCLGTDNWNSYKDNITEAQVTELTKYLNNTNADKPIFVLVHFPLHRYSSSRTTANAGLVIDALNNAVDSGKTIILLWGHNHSQSDPAYDQIYAPGYEIEYASGSKKTIKFYYAAAGCMSDTEYMGSSSVKGKGLVVTIEDTSSAASSTIKMAYLNASGSTLSSNDSNETINFKAGSGDSGTTYTLTDKLEADKEYLIATADSGNAYILSNEAGTATGSLKGYSVNIADGKITLDDTVPEANVAFSCVKDTASSDANSTWLEIDGKCLYMASKSDLSMADPVSGKYWHYIANDGTKDKNLLWFFQDSNDTTTNTYGYTWAGSIYRYYLQYSDAGEFTKGTLTSTTASLANTDTPKIYLFVKGDGSGSGDTPVATETRYVLTDDFKANGEYVLITEDNNGAHALKNAGSGSVGCEDSLTIYPADGLSAEYVKAPDASVIWTYDTSNSRTRLQNNSRYLTIENSTDKPLVTETHGSSTATYNASYTNSKIRLEYYGGTSSNYYCVGYSNGTFSSIKNDLDSGANFKLYIKTEVETDPVALEGISIDETASLEVGQTKDITVTFTPTNATNKSVTWESNNTSVATISNGTVTGVSEGTTTITATASDGGFTDTCVVTVTKSTAPKYVEVSSLEDGREYIIGATNGNNSVYALKNVATDASSTNTGSLELTVQPASGTNAAYIMTTDTGVVWTYRGNDQNMLNGDFRLSLERSTNLPRASSSNGYAVSFSNGTFKINNRNLTCSSGTFGTSSSSSATIRIFAKETEAIPVTNISLDKSSLSLEAGETATLTASIEPNNATNRAVTWTSSDNDVATVENGVVSAIGNGTATITVASAENNSITATCTVTVTEPEATRYVEVSSLQEGKNYIVAVTKDDNTVYVIRNNNGSLASAELTVTKNGNEAAYVETGNASVVWKYNGGDTHYLTNQTNYYLNITNSGTARDLYISTTSAYGVDYTTDLHMYLRYFAESTSQYYIVCSNGTFSAGAKNSSSNAATIRLFEEYDGSSVYYNVTLPEGFEGANTVKEGADYTFTKSADADEYNYGDVTYTMGGGASTPITADEDGVYTITNVTGNLVIYGTRTPKPATIYVLTDTLQPGKNYIIATGNSGTVHALINSNNTIASTDITVSDNKISTNNKDIVFTTVGNGTAVDNIMNGERYLRISGTSGYGSPSLAISTTVGSDRPWAYSSDNKLTCTVSNTSYYIYYTNTFSITTSATGTNSREIYLFVEDDGTTPHEHTYGEPEYAWAADNSTCTATAVCTGCEEGTDGHSVTETVTAAYAETTAATCTAAGSGIYTASFTNELFTQQTKDVVIPATGHTMTHHAAVAPTCTEDGNVEYWSCSKCEKNFSDEAGTSEITNIVVSATGHTMTHHAAVAPTCTEDGNVEYWSCSKCEKNFSDEAGTTEITNIVVSATGHNMTHHAAVAPTCTEAGTVEYWSCSVCKKNFSDEDGTTELTSIVASALGHSWGKWTQTTAPTCTAVGEETRICSRCDAIETREVDALGHNLTAHVAVVATCEAAGNSAYWSCDRCGKYFSDAQGTNEIAENGWVIPALGHDWNTPEYEWAADNSEVTATRTCKHDVTHVETETVNAIHEVISEATETEAGLVRYTSASFQNPAFKVQTKDVSIPPTGYEVTYEWAEDFSSVTATAVPYAQGAATVTETVQTTSAVTKDPTCDETGVTTYTATFTNALFSTQTKTKDIPALGHDWEFVNFTWTENDETGYAAVANYKCKHNEQHTQTVAATMTSETTNPTCEEDGFTVYTAAVTATNSLDGTAHTDNKTVTIEATGHDWQFVHFTWTGNDTAGYTAAAANYRCKNDSEHTKAIDLTVSSETTPATCETAGSTVYTATIAEADSPDGIAHTDTMTVVLPAFEHDWEFTDFTWTGSDEAGYTAVANYKCKNDATHTQTVNATVTSVTTAATCEVAGKTVYTATVAAADSLDGKAQTADKTVTIPATGHNWSAPEWTWIGNETDGYTGVKATFTCTNNSQHTQTVESDNVSVTGRVEPTPETNGSITYSASITGPDNRVYSIQKEIIIPATGYSFEDPEYNWAKTADGYTCSALMACKEDHTKDITETVSAAYRVATAPTCEGKGTGIYTATFTNSKFVTQYKEVEIAATGHDWNDPTYEWNADHTSVIATFVCKNDAKHTDTATASGSAITSEITTQPTATTPGVRTYTASITFGGKTYTATATETIPATGVSVSGNITSFVSNSAEGAVSVELFRDGSETAAYTATVSSDNKSYAFAGVDDGTYTMKVSKKDHATRTYEITVAGAAVTQDVKIHLLGDINGDGDVTTVDAARVNSHAKGKTLLTGYEFSCGDINGDEDITTVEAARTNAHAKGASLIWE